jgi:hypothetical protein
VPHPPERAAALANTAARSRQILLERVPNTEQWLVGVTEKDMLQKARMAALLMVDNGASPAPVGATFVGATQQHSGAWLLHMNTTAAASWLKAEMQRFLAAMGGTSSFKDRLLNVLVQFVPVSFDPTQAGNLRVVESDNSLARGVLTKVQWLKPMQRRHEGQRVAHAVFGFNDAKAANTFIRDGAWVEGSRVYGRKLLTEPIRCLKCQGVGEGHVAATCRSIHDVCARCGAMHRTDTCTVTNERRACANCRNAKLRHEGHGAADRSCPVFQNKLQYSLERNQEAKYPYFLIEDDSNTWDTHEDLSAAFARTGGTPAWKKAQAARGLRGPGPPAHVAAPIRTQMTQGGGAERRLFQPTLEEVMARPGASAQQQVVPDARMHPGRAALMTAGSEPPAVVVTAVGEERRSTSPPLESWSEEDEAAMKEVEEVEAAAATRRALLASRKAKWKAQLPVGPTTVTFHDDGVEPPRSAEHPAARHELPPASDDADDMEIEATRAPGVRTSPGSVADSNA